MFPSSAYATLKAGASNFGAPVVSARGRGPYFKGSTRWGDYSFAVPATESDSAWLAIEYIPPNSSQTTDGQRTGARASSKSRSADPRVGLTGRPG